MVCSILEHTTEHGAIAGKTQTSKVKYYNLDAVISVGYRVNSAHATHYAITGHTAAEIISLKADSSKPLMGMSTYKNAPDGRVLRSDSTVAKNYLDKYTKQWQVSESYQSESDLESELRV